MDKTQKMKPRNVLDDAVKFNFTKSQPLNTQLCTILCDKMGNPAAHQRVTVVSGKALVQLSFELI